MQLALYTPKPEQALQQAPEIRPAAIAGWLKLLPDSNPEEAAHRLLAELGRLNRSELEEDLRAKLILLYEPAIEQLIEALLATLPENGMPQSPVHRQAATLAYELAVELTYAWKLVCLGLQQRRSLFGSAKARQTALSRLLTALSGQICTSYRSYTSPPVYSWHELHQVRTAIAEAGLAESGDPDGRTPDAIYKSTVLLALAHPFRFTRPEIELTLAYLKKFGRLAELAEAGKGKKSVFRIDTDADSPSGSDENENPAGLLLDTHALCKHLRSLIIKLKTGEAFRNLGLVEVPQNVNALHLLSRLHQSWRGSAKRGFNRYTPGQSHVDVISGIPAIHRLFDTKQNGPAAPSSDSPEAAARWRIVNDSAGGLAMSAHALEVAQVRMGNPVALREVDAATSNWMLGVIRWGKMSKGQIVVAGVEKLAPSASSVVLRFTEGSAANIGQPAMLIPANRALQTEERLLLPLGLYRRGRTADMWLDGEHRRIGLGSLVEQTPFYDLVELIPA
ncbi:MAG: hypothetical protein AB1591_01855 [Pseudomonadota bacterium]